MLEKFNFVKYLQIPTLSITEALGNSSFRLLSGLGGDTQPGQVTDD